MHTLDGIFIIFLCTSYQGCFALVNIFWYINETKHLTQTCKVKKKKVNEKQTVFKICLRSVLTQKFMIKLTMQLRSIITCVQEVSTYNTRVDFVAYCIICGLYLYACGSCVYISLL